MKRTLKDRDIARMSALKSAVELTAAFHDDVAASGEAAAEVATRAAEKFYKWILQPAQGNDRIDQDDDDDEQGNYNQMVQKDCHLLQEKLGLKPTDFAKDPCPWGDWMNGGAVHLLETLRTRVKNGSKAGSFAGDMDKNGWKKNSVHGSEYGNGDYPISKKQFGYLIGLHKRLGLDYDKEDLNALTSRDASAMIEKLQDVEANGNGDSDAPF